MRASQIFCSRQAAVRRR